MKNFERDAFVRSEMLRCFEKILTAGVYPAEKSIDLFANGAENSLLSSTLQISKAQRLSVYYGFSGLTRILRAPRRSSRSRPFFSLTWYLTLSQGLRHQSLLPHHGRAHRSPPRGALLRKRFG